MPAFGRTSDLRLQTVDWRLLMIAEEAIKITDFTVLEGYRNPTRQDSLFNQGLSKVKGGDSKHNSWPSMAIDVAPYPIDWDDTERFVKLAGVFEAAAYSLGMQDELRWGGDWDGDNRLTEETFRDYGHFEIVPRRKIV
jgi:peptidoglycan L-alanyl-D-glutamate endopeptidase CwlK